MNKIYAKIIMNNGSAFFTDKCANLLYKKEFYTPYSHVWGVFVLKKEEFFSVENTKTIEVYFNEKILHKGMPDKISVKNSGEKNLLIFSSKSYTLLLGQNEPEPKINSNVNLEDLISKNISCPYISCQKDTEKVNYIYVKEHSTLWDAMVAYCLKAYGTRPFIRSDNLVCAKNEGQTIDYLNKKIIEKFSEKNTGNILSEIYMADSSGEYTFHMENDVAKNLGTERKKYIPTDNQWLSDPTTGLKGRLDFSMRKFMVTGFTYIGFMGEDLGDTVKNSLTDADNMRINSVTLKVNKNGIFTTVSCYYDAYGQHEQNEQN